MTVFENIKFYAKKHGMNLQTVAKKAGLSQNVIYQYNPSSKKHVDPSLETLNKIASVLDVPVSNLTKGDEKFSNSKPHIDIADDDNADILRFEGRPIPPDDLEVMKRYLRGGKGE